MEETKLNTIKLDSGMKKLALNEETETTGTGELEPKKDAKSKDNILTINLSSTNKLDLIAALDTTAIDGSNKRRDKTTPAPSADPSIPRHCAYCLLSIEPGKVNLCGKCNRRAYCSRECQVFDWAKPKAEAVGQMHKNFCKLPVCEEDIDWKVTEIPVKGLGIVALRPIRKSERILVDGCHKKIPDDHPGIHDLMPVDGTLESKFELNSLCCNEEDKEAAPNGVLCFRLARVNHSCRPNADHFFMSQFNVQVLYANRDIAEGEEICISYVDFLQRKVEESIEILKDSYGIICSQDCQCRDSKFQACIEKSRALDEQIQKFAIAKESEKALKAVKKLIVNHEILDSSLMERRRTLYDGFQVAMIKRKTHKEAYDYLLKAIDILEPISHPKFEDLVQYADFVRDLFGY